MITYKKTWLLAGPLCLVLWSAPSLSQGRLWEVYMTVAGAAYQQGDYVEAENQFSAAIKKAESFGPRDPRLGVSFENLGSIYRLQGKYAEAESVDTDSLTIFETTLGMEHPLVARSLSNLARHYHGQGRNAEAEPLYKRDFAIRRSG